MPTKRLNPAAVYAKMMLVVAGGQIDLLKFSNIVEILNTRTEKQQWASAKSLPMKMNAPSATICENYVYIHPRALADDPEKNSVYKCSLEQLVQSQPSLAIWENFTPLPISNSSLVTINGHLLAVGGENLCDNEDKKIRVSTNFIYQYKNSSWSPVGQMQISRSAPLIAALPKNKLMVVGGGQQALRKCELYGYC